jgi:hypothetical protein
MKSVTKFEIEKEELVIRINTQPHNSAIRDGYNHAPLPTCRWHGGEEYTSYSFLNSALDGVSGRRHAPAAVASTPPPPIPLGRRLGGPQSWSGHRG